MRRTKFILMIILLAVTCSNILAQESKKKLDSNRPKNEVKLNLLYSLFLFPEITYERLLSNNQGIGLSLATYIKPNELYDIRHATTTYYRLYFDDKEAKGIFVEGNCTVIWQTSDFFIFESSTRFAIGTGLGAKFINEHNWLVDFYIGFDRIITQDKRQFPPQDTRDFDDFFPRIGVSLGKRF